jgi:uncharacterized protein YuzE
MQSKIICRENASLIISVQRDDDGEFMAGYIRLLKKDVTRTAEVVADEIYADMGEGNQICGIEILDKDVWDSFKFDENILTQNSLD